jgi:hypothetical protein
VVDASEIATLVIHVIALIMTLIMILNVKSKYTAVGEAYFRVYIFCLKNDGRVLN